MNNMVHVAVGVIIQNNHFFLTKRSANAHQGNKWEFPGGKVENDEKVHQALARELKEEVAIDVLSCQPLITINHLYSDKKVCLEVFLVDNFSGEPHPLEGQESGWFTLKQLSSLTFPEANLAIIKKLQTLKI